MMRLVTKIWALPFYRAHAVFFGILFLLLFGTVQGGALVHYHLSLMQSMLRSPAVLAGVFLAWGLYHVACLHFCQRLLKKTESRFLYLLQILPLQQKIGYFLLAHAQLHLPILIYSAFCIFLGFRQHDTVQAAALILFQVLLALSSVVCLNRQLSHWTRFYRAPGFRLGPLNTSLLLLPFNFLVHMRRKAILLQKIFSCAVLYVGLVLNREPFRSDGFILLYLLVLAGHIRVPFRLVDFLETEGRFYRILPYPMIHRVALFFTTYSLLMLPELAYLAVAGWSVLGPAPLIFYALDSLLLLFLFTALQYSGSRGKADLNKTGFVLFFLSVFAFHAQAFLAWTLILALVSGILFLDGYPRYHARRSDAIFE